jgi:hypothetical protein
MVDWGWGCGGAKVGLTGAVRHTGGRCRGCLESVGVAGCLRRVWNR